MKLIQFIEKEISLANIKAMADNGEINSGDLIPFTLKNGEEVAIRATYDEKSKLFFVLEDCLNETHAMNNDATNKGGWAECEMREYLNATIYALLPDELQALIKPTKIVQVLDGEHTECEDKLFLLSKTQVFGEGSYSNCEPEDSHFDIFKREKDRVKECDCHSTYWWWLRSPYASGNTTFWAIASSGNSDYASANYIIGVAFGFCIN